MNNIFISLKLLVYVNQKFFFGLSKILVDRQLILVILIFIMFLSYVSKDFLNTTFYFCEFSFLGNKSYIYIYI